MAPGTFYTVDRGNGLAAGDVLRLDPAKDKDVRRWFPAGLSDHGRDFALAQDADAEGVRIELTLELIRRHKFAEKPSRLQAFFAFSTLADARRFRHEKDEDAATIWELRGESGHRGDMRLLKWKDDLMADLEWAEKYWSGKSTPSPKWEHLLRPPVRVLGRADAKP